MEVVRSRLLSGAVGAEGVAVVIDVFRAFSVCAYAAALGARPLVAVADAQQGQRLRRRRPGAILSGESGGWPLPGYDLGNSPAELLRAASRGLHLSGRALVQRTGAGTQGVVCARRASRVYAAALVNAVATALAIRKLDPPRVTLVAMGRAAHEPTEEDEVCAEAIEAYLKGETWPAQRRLSELWATPRVQSLLAGELPPFPPADVALCLAFNLFDFALRARRLGDVAVMRPVPVPEARLFERVPASTPGPPAAAPPLPPAAR